MIRKIFQTRNQNIIFNSKSFFSTYDYDLVIVGGGPAGYVGAIRAGQAGLKVACVEKRGALGGTCLNVGCIPSKAMLNISHKYEEANQQYTEFGIDVKSVSLNWPQVQKKKTNIVSSLTKGVEFLFRKNKVDYLQGFGKLVSNNSVLVNLNAGGSKTVTTKNVMISTGSDAIQFPGLPFDEKVIISSTGALSLPKVPKDMIIIGGGVIGLELGQVYQRFGTKVTVIEYLDRIISVADKDLSSVFTKIITKHGFILYTGHKVTSGKNLGDCGEITFEPVKGGPSITQKAEVVLVATGRRPFTDGLGAEALGIKFDNKKRIIVNKSYQTNVPNIYAVGDIIDGPMLAHKAEDEAVAVVDVLTGKKAHVNYNTIPSVVYSHPEIAWVGKTEDELKTENVAYNKGQFPFLANARAKANDDPEGLIKVLSDKVTGKILGCHIIGPQAGELIAEGVLAMEHGITAEQVGRTCHSHPTLSEALKEACIMAASGKAIHF